MSQSQGIEVRRPSRRTIAAGAAWAVPVIAVGAAAPAMAASGVCVPAFTTVEGSFKCCDGTNVDANGKKNMKLVIQVTDANGCLDEGTDTVCITDVQLANNQTYETLKFVGGQCVSVGGTVTAYLLVVDSCTVNLLVTYTLNGGSAQIAAVKSDNISKGNDSGDCKP